MESIESFYLLPWTVQNTLINGIWDTIIDQFGKHKTILAFIKHLECICWERKTRTQIRVSSKDGIDMSGELSPFILINGMCNIRRRTLNLNAPAHTRL